MKASSCLAGVSGWALALLLAAPASALDLQGADAAAERGEVAFTTVSIGFDPGYDLVAWDIAFEYDPALLDFRADQSRVLRQGTEESLADFLSYLSTQGQVWPSSQIIVNGMARNRYAFYTSDDPAYLALAGNWTITAAFQVQASGDADAALVGINTNLADWKGRETALDVQVTVTVLATPSVPVVPEPETWALWLAGLGLVARRFIGRTRA